MCPTGIALQIIPIRECNRISIMFFGSANFNKKGMVELSELNILLKSDKAMVETWKNWRHEHLEAECTRYLGDSKLPYKRLYAFVESMMC